MIVFILSSASLLFGIFNTQTLIYSVASWAFQGWVLYVCYKTYKLMSENTAPAEELTQQYPNTPCKCI